MTELILVAILALAIGALVGWLIASRRGAALASDLAVATSRAADFDIVRQARDAVERERNDAVRDLAAVRAQHGSASTLAEQLRAELTTAHADRHAAHTQLATLKAQADGFETRLAELREAKDVMAAQFAEVGTKLLTDAQKAFLDRADHRFRQSEETAGQNLKALLQPVNERLQRYEEGVRKVEAERRDAFGELKGQIEHMRVGQESVRSEAAKLVNALRNAPKARGRWGEQQLRNVLETCGLAEHTDFLLEVSVADGEGGRLRPDAIVRVPGGKSLIIDAKVSLNAYQDAFGAVDETERLVGLRAHAESMRAHVNGLGNKAYWSQFDDTPEYVVMFVPGEHFLSAALEHDPTLWDFAFDKRVLLATPTNLIAIARTVSAVWRQEKLANQAREIAALGKDLYARLSVMGGHVARLGKNLDTAMGAYNSFVGSLESQVLTQARRFEALDIETGGKAIEALPVGEQSARPVTKLALAGEGRSKNDDLAGAYTGDCVRPLLNLLARTEPRGCATSAPGRSGPSRRAASRRAGAFSGRQVRLSADSAYEQLSQAALGAGKDVAFAHQAGVLNAFTAVLAPGVELSDADRSRLQVEAVPFNAQSPAEGRQAAMEYLVWKFFPRFADDSVFAPTLLTFRNDVYERASSEPDPDHFVYEMLFSAKHDWQRWLRDSAIERP